MNSLLLSYFSLFPTLLASLVFQDDPNLPLSEKYFHLVPSRWDGLLGRKEPGKEPGRKEKGHSGHIPFILNIFLIYSLITEGIMS